VISPPSDETTREDSRLRALHRRNLSGRERWLRVLQRATLTGADYPTRRMAEQQTLWVLLGFSAVFGALCGLAVLYSIDLPQMEDLARYRPNTTTELLDIHGRQIGSFALERRVVMPYSEIPPVLRSAIISIEDKSFESNWGINVLRVGEAALTDLHEHGRAQGASTLTMQLARNLFLSSRKTYSRKLQEIFLTIQIERRFTKDQIFTLYANQIYLGHGRYGFEAGSEFYFSKHVRDLTLPEAALLAALPKGPEAYSPVRHPARALARRNLVLSEMRQDHKITAAQMAAAQAEPLGLKIEEAPNSVAPYFVEEVRQQLEREYGVDEVHGAGLRVYTTLDLDLQKTANRAVLDGVARYERRHGWRTHLQNVNDAGLDPETYRHPDWTAGPVVEGDYVHAMVTSVTAHSVSVKVDGQRMTLSPEDWAWTHIPAANKFLRVGDLVYVHVTAMGPDGLGKAHLEEDTGTQGSLMAIDNANGEVLAMVGGRDFALSQFNRATQSERQVGSSFKPYVYTAAMEAGMTPDSIVLDEPASFPTPNGPYTPHNYEEDWKGPITLTAAFAESRNIPALRIADKVGIKAVIAVARRFGITSPLPPFLPVAIGAAGITLAEQVSAYSTFPNDGIRMEPHYIRRVTQANGVPLDSPNAGVSEVISVDTARTMMVLLKAVVEHGTGFAASALHHPLAGKTGTTNNFTDAWFVGFSPSVTCGTWVGFDDRTSLGKKETGAQAALPIWMDLMKVAIAGKPDEKFPEADAPRKVLGVPAAPAIAAPAGKDAEPEADDEAPNERQPEHQQPEAIPAAVPVAPDAVPVAPDTTPGERAVAPAEKQTAPPAKTGKPALQKLLQRFKRKHPPRQADPGSTPPEVPPGAESSPTSPVNSPPII
jgi:penicillin-binding protein 1A